jgi:hypothetical protein
MNTKSLKNSGIRALAAHSMKRLQADTGRLRPNAGIAIGPILFIIALLAILAAAIAAGSGSFTAGTGTESNRTKSSALVEIGENLKMGMDNITMSTGISPTSVIIDPAQTTASGDLFSPTGGGIAPPSISMSNVPGTDIWHYLAGPVAGLGTGAGDVVAVLAISSGVCAEVNNRTTGVAATPATADLGNFNSDSAGTLGTIAGASWPTTGPDLVGVASGCVQNSNTSSVGTFFYQVIAIQ